MTTILLVMLFALDIVILAYIYVTRRKTTEFDVNLAQEMNEERRILSELRDSVRQELQNHSRQSKEALDRVSRIAAEVDQEFKNNAGTIASDLETVVKGLEGRFEVPFQRLVTKEAAIESLGRRLEKQKLSLQKLVERGEKICRFFDQRLPFEQILDEIEDKKYVDARHLLTQGMKPAEVSKELGISLSEIHLIANMR